MTDCPFPTRKGDPDDYCPRPESTNCWDCVCARLQELEAENKDLRARYQTTNSAPSTAERIALAARQLHAQKN